MSGTPQSSLPPVPPRLDLLPHRTPNPPGASSPGVSSKVTKCTQEGIVKTYKSNIDVQSMYSRVCHALVGA